VLFSEKFETRNSKLETISKNQNSNDQNMVLSAPKLFSEKFGELEHSDFEFVPYFDIRASNLLRINPDDNGKSKNYQTTL